MTVVNIKPSLCGGLLAHYSSRCSFCGPPRRRALASSADTGLTADTASPTPLQAPVAAAPFTFGIYSITEGMKDFPIQKQLTNTMPLSLDFSIIFCIGWTGDKLYIKLTDDGGDGDRLQGIAIAQYEGRETSALLEHRVQHDGARFMRDNNSRVPPGHCGLSSVRLLGTFKRRPALQLYHQFVVPAVAVQHRQPRYYNRPGVMQTRSAALRGTVYQFDDRSSNEAAATSPDATGNTRATERPPAA